MASRHGVIAPEGKGYVAHAAAHQSVGACRFDPPGRLDEGDRVAVVRLDAGADGKNVRVEDDVLGRETDPVDQQIIGAPADPVFRSTVSAWPCSSKAITITAAP